MINLTVGNSYIDIDGYASCIAYRELLKIQGIEAKFISSATLNYSVTNTLLNLPYHIDEHKIDEFYIAGADATACVKSTCYNLRKAGYTVYVISDSEYEKYLDGRKEEIRSDFPSFLDKNEGNFDQFLMGARDFEKKRKPKIFALRRKYPMKEFIVLKSREEISSYLKEISAEI